MKLWLKKYEFKKGCVPWNKGLRGYRAGEKSNFWKGGKTPLLKRIRSSIEYHDWRMSIFKRDNFQCQNCGNKNNIQADHIKPISLFPKLIFDLNNGRTLCKECHKKTLTYGGGAQTSKRKIKDKVVNDYKDILITDKETRKCKLCGKEVVLPRHRLEEFKFCSRKCRDLSKRGKPTWGSIHFKKGMQTNTGRTHFPKGHIPWNKTEQSFNQCTA
jgi:hypothetical protein